jgi:hypothetical protein
MNEKKSEIKNFIGIYDNYITEEECNKAIELFENESAFKKTLTRVQFENASFKEKKDEQFFANAANLKIWWSQLKPMVYNFDMAFKHYCQHTGANEHFEEFHYSTIKIQKTLPTEGYHVWHVEHGRGYENEPRVFAWSIYLNDVEEGGETEFLNQSVRVKPKIGRIVIWPASFPFVHRGNPPLSGKKYIITSWMNLR